MRYRLALLALLVTGASAAPMTYTITGTGSGYWNSQPFTEARFTFTFTSDTSAIVHGTSCCAGADSTPSGTTASVNVSGFAAAALAGNQAIFMNQSELTAGIWHFDSPDYLTITSQQFRNRDLTTTIPSNGPVANGQNYVHATPLALSTGGSLYFTSVHDVLYSQEPGNAGGQVSTDSVTPNNSTPAVNTTQTFTAVVSDAAGASDIGGLDLLIGEYPGFAYACWVYFNAGANTLAIYHQGNWGPPTPIGSSGATLTGDACTVDTKSTTVSASGNTLSLNLPTTITFADNNTWYIYLSAQNKENLSTSYNPMGTVTPQSSQGAQDFTLSVSPSQFQARPTGTSIDYTVTVTPMGGYNQPVTFTAHAAPSKSGNTTQLSIAFNPAKLPSGSGSTTMTVSSDSSATPDTYGITVTAGSQSVIHSQSVNLELDNSAPMMTLSPTSGSGANATLTLTWSEPASTLNVLIAPSVDGRNACWIYFDVSGTGPDGLPHRLFLANDDGTSWMDAGDAGFTPFQAGTAHASNSQCTIGGPGVNFDPDGGYVNGVRSGHLTLTLPIAFASALGGTKTVYIRSSNDAGFDSGYLPKGGWTVQ
jgi:hypothetical protein